MKKKLLLKIGCATAVGLALASTYWFVFRAPHSQQYFHGAPPSLAAVFPSDSRDIFDTSASLTLYSLDPGDVPRKGKKVFHGYVVAGTASISGAHADELRRAFYANAALPEIGALCFEPHHGVRAQKGGKTVDLVICFTCGLLYSYHGVQPNKEPTASSGMQPFATAGMQPFVALFKKAGLKMTKSTIYSLGVPIR